MGLAHGRAGHGRCGSPAFGGPPNGNLRGSDGSRPVEEAQRKSKGLVDALRRCWRVKIADPSVRGADRLGGQIVLGCGRSCGVSAVPMKQKSRDAWIAKKGTGQKHGVHPGQKVKYAQQIT